MLKKTPTGIFYNVIDSWIFVNHVFLAKSLCYFCARKPFVVIVVVVVVVFVFVFLYFCFREAH